MTRHGNLLEGQRVLVTGHTGFKGAWLSRLLTALGAEVFGLALEPEKGSLYERISPVRSPNSVYANVVRLDEVRGVVDRVRPSLVFHLAAQPLVLRSYEIPISTFETNVIGTANVLEALRGQSDLKAIVVVTTDKVYANDREGHALVETDPLGGKDPYSASKAATEMVAEAWRGLFSHDGRAVSLVTARSGNVIGGGDVSRNRLLPDLVRSFRTGAPASVRSPAAIRPWQHVLDALWGYVLLAREAMSTPGLTGCFNFGPGEESKMTVAEVAEHASHVWPERASWIADTKGAEFRETGQLWLSSAKAHELLGWTNRLTAAAAIEWTIHWELKAADMHPLRVLDEQISTFMELPKC